MNEVVKNKKYGDFRKLYKCIFDKCNPAFPTVQCDFLPPYNKKLKELIANKNMICLYW